MTVSLPTLYQKIENLAIFFTSLFFYIRLDYKILWFVLLLFSIDIFMFGYLFNNKIGAHIYNFGHNFLPPLVLLVEGMLIHQNLGVAFSLI
ncbi:MAG: hypothetical protein NVS3B9_6840 [Candidatus Doudnabacteria bacterium]